MITRKSVKQHIRHALQTANDLQNGYWWQFARPGGEEKAWPVTHRIEQAIRPSSTVHQKQNNIRLACTRISRVGIKPGQIFSFWNTLGAPTSRKGYEASRNIVAGKLALETGGGLCQVAGLLYHLALATGLEVLERHAHSVDIYSEEERFTPLGSDAAVVYGYKDLRLRNNQASTVLFRFEQSPDTLTGMVTSPKKLQVFQLEFLRQKRDEVEIVETVRHTNTGHETITWSKYGKPSP